MRKKLTFVLKGVSISKIDVKYGITTCSNIINKVEPDNTTKISDLVDGGNKNGSYTTVIKGNKILIPMYDYIKNDIPLTNKTHMHCFWCRHMFDTAPIGCPIKRNPLGGYFTDGIFCSFNCCIAFSVDNSRNILYNESKSLIYSLYHDIFQQYPSSYKLTPAPHWRLLSVYGGHMSIEEFRNSFESIEFFNTYNMVRMTPSGMMFIETQKF